jgi:hypothetical protein
MKSANYTQDARKLARIGPEHKVSEVVDFLIEFGQFDLARRLEKVLDEVEQYARDYLQDQLAEQSLKPRHTR